MEPSEMVTMRKAAGMLQTELAALLDVNASMISHWENGRYPIRARDALAIRSVLTGKVRAKAVPRNSAKSKSSK